MCIVVQKQKRLWICTANMNWMEVVHFGDHIMSKIYSDISLSLYKVPEVEESPIKSVIAKTTLISLIIFLKSSIVHTGKVHLYTLLNINNCMIINCSNKSRSVNFVVIKVTFTSSL